MHMSMYMCACGHGMCMCMCMCTWHVHVHVRVEVHVHADAHAHALQPRLAAVMSPPARPSHPTALGRVPTQAWDMSILFGLSSSINHLAARDLPRRGYKALQSVYLDALGILFTGF